jgi:hypothetical protein
MPWAPEIRRTVSAAEEQELLRYRWLSNGLSRSAAVELVG